jgi:Na+-driven multidrug efflux pump
MKYTLLFKPVQAVMDIMSGCLQGYGYTLVPAIVSAFSVCGVRLLWIFTVFPHNRSLETLMMIYPITQGLAAISHTVCYLLLVRKIKQKGKI